MLSKPAIKYIQSLQHKKFRDEYAVFVAEGPKLVNEFLKDGNFELKAVYATDSWKANIDAETLAFSSGKLFEISEIDLGKIAAYTTPNQVIALFGKKPVKDIFETRHELTLVLDDIQDPGNLGTIIRTADWFGVKNIVCSTQTADMYNSKVVQSTMASLGRVNVLYTDIVAWLKKNDHILSIATVLNGKPVRQFESTKEAIIVIGNESKGISSAVLELCKEKITIPRFGNAESLNAGVAAGIVLFAMR